jgi:hypothetical protein
MKWREKFRGSYYGLIWGRGIFLEGLRRIMITSPNQGSLSLDWDLKSEFTEFKAEVLTTQEWRSVMLCD